MIVPGFIVNRIYRKRSLQRDDRGYYSFSFKNTLARGKATLVAVDRIKVESQIGNIELSRFPELFVDGRPVPREDAMMIIGGIELPHYDAQQAEQLIGQSLSFQKGDDFITKVRGDLPDGKHDFKSVFHSLQFGEIILNFSDYMGEAARPSIWNRIKSRLFKSERAEEEGLEPEPVTDTRLYILKDKRPDPDFSRLLTAFKLTEPDRVPLIELMVDEEVKEAFLGRSVTSMKDEVEFWLATGYDYVPLMVINITPRNVAVIDSHQTSYKDGLQERAWILESDGAITSLDDLAACEWPEADDSLFSNYEEIAAFLPPEMKVIGTVSALFETVTQAMGLQTFCINLYDNPQLIDEIFHKAGKLIGDCVEKMLQFDHVGAVWITDDLAYNQGAIIDPQLYRQYIYPWYKRYAKMVHDAGRPFLLHSCGNTKPLFEDIIDIGFDALHPLESNAVDIYQAKKDIGSRICLMGNVDLSYMLPRGSIDEITEDVKKLIGNVGTGGGFCLGSSNSIPNYVPLDKYLAMNRACMEFGKYKSHS